MILITHQIADIIPEMQRVVMMRQGRIVADGPREELLTASTLSTLFATEVRVLNMTAFFTPGSYFACGSTEVCSFTNSGSGNRVGPSTAIFGRGPRTIATSSHA